jgi:transposase
MELVTLTTKEVRRLEVLQALAARTLRQAQAARILEISVRQLKRLWRRYRTGGPAALASARRGRVPNNAIRSDLKTRVLQLYRAHYPDFGPTFACEKLRQRDGLTVNRETLRQWLIAENLWHAQQRERRARPPRARRHCFGELVQIDGSPHHWFEKRGPRCTLLLAIDDATGLIGAAHFAKAETTNGYFLLFEQYFRAHGLPEAFYSDRHSIFRINVPLQEERQTQLARAVHELGIDLICANSPQAKGRVERANRTFQDRLVKDMRLRGIYDMDSANAYLPEFLLEHNRKFAKAPALEFNAHRRAHDLDLDRILCQCAERTLTKNLTFQLRDCIYAINEPHLPNTLGAGVRVQLRLQRDGQLLICHNGRDLKYRLVQRLERNAPILGAKELAERPPKPRSMPQRAPHPKPDHPWKTTKLPHAWGAVSELHSGDISVLR